MNFDRLEDVRANPMLGLLKKHESLESLVVDNQITREYKLRQWILHWQRQGIEFRAEGFPTLAYNATPISLKTDDCRPRIVGLVVSEPINLGYVLPLTIAKTPNDWEVSDSIPIAVDEIQAITTGFAQAASAENLTMILATCGLSLTSDLPRTSGTSMDLVLLLAILDFLSDRQARIFSSVCALGSFEGSKLVQVGSVKAKIDAFWREYGRGTLLISHPDDDVATNHAHRFEKHWQVRSMTELAQHLEGICEIKTLLHSDRGLSNADLTAFLDRIQAYENSGTFEQFRESLQQCLLMQTRASQDLVGLATLEQAIGKFMHHLGNASDAVSYFEKLTATQLERFNNNQISHDQYLNFLTNLAATYVDTHHFEKGVELLSDQRSTISSNLKSYSLGTLYKYHNTLGRLLVRLNILGWDEEFRKSLKIQRDDAPQELQRTRNFFIEGLLRTNKLEECRVLIRQQEADTELNAYSREFLHFYRADLARRAGEQSECLDGSHFTKLPYTYAFYLQAIARQQGRSRAERLDLLDRAALLLKKLADDDEANLLHLLQLFIDVGISVLKNDIQLRDCTRAKIDGLLDQANHKSMKRHYASALPQPNQSFEWTDFERLISLFPYI